jgi:hypothetical protein
VKGNNTKAANSDAYLSSAAPGNKSMGNPTITSNVDNPFNKLNSLQLPISSSSSLEERNSTRLSVEQIKSLLQNQYPNYKQYLLSDFSSKKQKQMQIKFLLNESKANNSDPVSSLRRSKLLLENERELIFFTLPFFSKLPSLSLIYSTIDHRRDLEELYVKTSKVRCIFLLFERSLFVFLLSYLFSFVFISFFFFFFFFSRIVIQPLF